MLCVPSAINHIRGWREEEERKKSDGEVSVVCVEWFAYDDDDGVDVDDDDDDWLFLVAVSGEFLDGLLAI